MKKYLLPPLLFFYCILFTGCNTASPEKYFDVAVLNCNTIAEFGNGSFERELESPSVKLAEGSTTQTVTMKRSEVVDDKIQIIESHFQEVKELKQTDDTKDIIQSSLALHEFVLPIFKNEYRQLAGLFDQGASKEETQSMAKAIYDKYSSRYNTLYDAVTNAGKAYATKHNIKVNWGIQTSPQ